MVVSSWILLKEDGSVFLAALSRALKKDERGEIGENWKKEESRDRHVKTRASYNNPIFPFLGMKKVNQFPLVGFFFESIPKNGIKFLNQFPMWES